MSLQVQHQKFSKSFLKGGQQKVKKKMTMSPKE